MLPRNPLHLALQEAHIPDQMCAARRRHALAVLSVCLQSTRLARTPQAEAATLPPPPPVGNCPDCLGAGLLLLKFILSNCDGMIDCSAWAHHLLMQVMSAGVQVKSATH